MKKLFIFFFLIFAVNAQAALQNDNFDDNSIDTSFWTAGTVQLGTVAEQNQQLEVDWTTLQVDFAYLVTAGAHDLSTADIQVDVKANTGNASMWIALTKVTATNPHAEASWYRIMRYHATVGPTNTLYVQKKVNGGSVTTLENSASTATGTMRITISGGVITFYAAGVEVHSEAYALSTTTAYVYILGGQDEGDNLGDADFDDFLASSASGSTLKVLGSTSGKINGGLMH